MDIARQLHLYFPDFQIQPEVPPDTASLEIEDGSENQREDILVNDDRKANCTVHMQQLYEGGRITMLKLIRFL